MSVCSQCSTSFYPSEAESRLREKISPLVGGTKWLIPPPKLCPSCREQRRLAFRNERHLYHTESALSGRKLISTFPPDAPFEVYHHDEWWSDNWDAESFGREYDFSRPFFAQLAELWRDVPQQALFNTRSENSEYTNFSEQEKNCYLTFASNRNEDCLYSEYIWDSRRCVDCSNIEKSELLYSCVNCSNCYDCTYCEDCHNSSELHNCADCRASSNLFACAGLRKSSFCILNRQYSESEYRRRVADPDRFETVSAEYQRLKASTPRLFAKLVRCENVTGSNLRDCKSIVHGFNAFDCEDAFYIENIPGKARDLIDVSGATNSELGCELVSVAYGYTTAFTIGSHTGLRNSYYTAYCHSGANLFGCVGLRNKEHCILNRRYERTDYQNLLTRILEQMTQTGEWGEFFPASISPWSYNETVACDHYPLTKEQVEQRGLRWKSNLDGSPAAGKCEPLSVDASDRTETILGRTFACAQTGRPYRIIPQELDFLRKNKLPLPRVCPDVRYRERLKLLPPRTLSERRCDCVDPIRFDKLPACRCPNVFETPYSPASPNPVFCEECYLQHAY